MTKRRQPLTLAAALTRIADIVGWDEMAEATRRRPSMVRAWADPDRREEVPLRDAIQLDRAYQASGGAGAPLFEVYADRLDIAGTYMPAEAIALVSHAGRVVRECGEATDALITASLAKGDARARAEAQRQVEEAIEVLRRALPLLVGPAAFDPLFSADTHPSTGPP